MKPTIGISDHDLGTADFVTGLMEKHKNSRWMISTSEYYDETESELNKSVSK
ncbi:MAG: hypothetical protein WC780_13630 [Lentimicrobiaceae bacterium]|jgi:hypothetical protein